MLKRTLFLAAMVLLVSLGGVLPAAYPDEEGAAPPEKKESAPSGRHSGASERKIAVAFAITALITLSLVGAFWKLARGYDPRVTSYYRQLGDEAEAHFRRGQELYDQGNRKRAISEFREAIFISPDHWAAHRALGNALKDAGDRGGAIRELRLYLDRSDGDEAAKQAARQAILELGG